jgi:hypothetical protein
VRRVLLKARFVPLVCFGMLLWAGPLTAQAATPGPAAGFAVLSAAPNGLGHVACTTSTIKGDVGSTGAVAPVGCVITGNTVAPVSAAVVADFNSAYSALKKVPCDHILATLDVTQTLTPGVYCFAAGATATGKILTLSGPASGIWLFKIGTGGTGALTGTDFSVVMAGGGQACNVNWWTAEAATLTVDNGKTVALTPFSGNILAGAAATTTGTAGAASALTLTGRVWAGAGVTVTDSNIVGCTTGITVPKPTCKSGTSTDTDENSDQSKDIENSSKSESSDNGNDEQGNHDKDCKSGDSDKDKSDKHESNKDDSNKDDSKRSGD